MTIDRNSQAEETREKIIKYASEEMYKTGFQAASVAEIIKKAGISKGCFYHHFETKQSLGYAVLDESFFKTQFDLWHQVLTSENALAAIIKLLSNATKNIDCDQIKLGCPINNLAQEMSPIDEGFRERVENIYQSWRTEMTKALLRAQKSGYMKKSVEAQEISTMIIAVAQGAIGIAKNAQQPKIFADYTKGLIRYLRTLQLS